MVRRLEGDAEDDVLAIGDAALHAAAAVGDGGTRSPSLMKAFVVLGAFQQRAREAGADLEALAGGRLIIALARSASSLSKTGSPRPTGRVAHDAGDDAAERIASRARLLNERNGALGIGGVGPADDGLLSTSA